MKVTRNVITDLLPLYLADEASADSSMLIQKFLEQDPEFAKLITTINSESFIPKDVPEYSAPDQELSALTKTKRFINLRSWLMGSGFFFTTSLFGIRSIGNGIEWIWAGFLVGFFICLCLALGSWIAYFTIRHRLIKIGL